MDVDERTRTGFLQAVRETDPAQLLAPGGARLRLHRDRRWEAHWAPFEPLNQQAEIVLVGTTPGYQQALDALQALRAGLLRGMSASNAMVLGKTAGAFSGEIRRPLEAMLDFLAVPQRMGLSNAASLLDGHPARVHLTSALRYPVFEAAEPSAPRQRRGYGGSDSMLDTPWMRAMVESLLAEELRALPDARVFPMGQRARAAVAHLVARGVLDAERVYYGMQHPSTGNRMDVIPFIDPSQASTHPRWQRRMQRVAAERAEILAKLARDWPLRSRCAA